MENNDLKKLWDKSVKVASTFDSQSLLAMLQAGVKRSNQAMIRKLTIELGVMAASLMFVIWAIFYFASAVSGFLWWMFVLYLLFLVPNGILFIFSILQARRFDFSDDLRKNLSSALKQYTRTTRLYLISSYLFSALIIIPILVSDFPEASPERLLYIRIGYVIFVGLVSLLYKPYIRWMFGRKMKELEDQLNSLEKLES